MMMLGGERCWWIEGRRRRESENFQVFKWDFWSYRTGIRVIDNVTIAIHNKKVSRANRKNKESITIYLRC